MRPDTYAYTHSPSYTRPTTVTLIIRSRKAYAKYPGGKPSIIDCVTFAQYTPGHSELHFADFFCVGAFQNLLQVPGDFLDAHGGGMSMVVVALARGGGISTGVML